MNNVFKKSTAIVMCIFMLFSAVPLSVFAQTEVPQTDIENDVSMEATSAFGGMLTDAIDTQDIDADSPYFISNLIFDGNKATASYYNEAACTLVVAVYDEEIEQMIDSAVTSVETESLEATVSFSSLPENFVAKAFLLDENNASLCKPYTCNENTTAYKEFISKTVEDFEEDRVINLDESLTNNFVVLTDDTIIVNGNNETNVLESADVENDEYIFSNIDEQIKNLRVGDMFYLDNGDEENITVIKIASISVEGDKAIIIADNTTLAESFEYVKISTEADAEDMVYDGSEADEGVTYLGDVDYETGEPINPDDSEIGTQAVDVGGTKTYSKSFKFEEKDVTATIFFKADVTLKACFGFSYGEVSFTVDPSAKVTVEVEDKINKEFNFGKIEVCGIPGAAVYIDPTIVFEFSGKLTVTGELKFTLGFGWNSNSGFVNKCKKPSFKPVVEAEVTFFIGFDLKPQFTIIHENVANALLSGMVGVDIEAFLTTELEEGHSCVSCIDGVINGKLNISVTLSVAKTTSFGGEWKENVYNMTVKIADFYFSVGHVSFGWGECPYKNDGSGGETGGSGDIGGDDLPYYSLTFLDGYGGTLTVDYLRYGADICDYIPDEIPKKDYYRFIGWCDEDGKAPSEYNWMPDYNVTFKPCFERLPVKLVCKEGSTTVIDYSGDYNLIYGLENCLTVDRFSDYLSVENGGYFEVTCAEGYTSYFGTGAVIKLYDSLDKSLVESFYVVIFGDLNGDSRINATDASIAENEASALTNWSQEFSFNADTHEFIPNPDYSICKATAADLNNDGLVDSIDANIIKLATLGHVSINQTTGDYTYCYATGNEKVGDKVYFGSYPQSKQSDGTYEVEPIEWRVLENKNGELLLLSEKILDVQPYHNIAGADTTWAECSLRTWLNNNFYNTAFNENEQGLISTTNLVNGNNPFSGISGGKNTQDRIYLLSYSDCLNADYGFSTSAGSSDTRLPVPSKYAEDKDPGASNWWLRTPGKYGSSACHVYTSGSIGSDGYYVLSPIGIRPALRINLNSALASDSLETQSVSYTLDNGVDTLGFSYDKCIAGNTYTLLNVTDYGEGFELSSDNLYYINTVSADENGKVNTSFIPKANAENSALLLIGDFGNGTETVVVEEWYNKYTITWNTVGETVTQTVIEGAEIIAPENPEKIGYTFTGWTPSIPETMPDYDLTFTATWAVNKYDAVFNANGGMWADGATEMTVSTEYGAEIIAPETPVKQGYIFSKWSPEIGVMDSVDGKSFTAEWIPATDTRYTVETNTMNTAGEYEKTVQTLSGKTGETVSTNPEIKAGFTFNTEKSILSGTVAADNSLVLKVFIDRNTYTFVTVIDGVSAETKYYYGSMISEPVSPAKDGYKFMGWDTEIPSTMPAKNVTVTAVFEKSYICPDCGEEILGEDAINAHIATEENAKIKATINIKNNSGSKTINYGETLRLTAVTTDMPADAKIYWYVDGKKVDEGETFEVSPSSGSVEITVKIVDSNGKVLINADGNEVSDSQKVSVNSSFWQKIVSFFKNLFGLNRTVVQLFKAVY